jgi:hypothetical protein
MKMFKNREEFSAWLDKNDLVPWENGKGKRLSTQDIDICQYLEGRYCKVGECSSFWNTDERERSYVVELKTQPNG